MTAEDVKSLMALPPDQRLIAERTGIVPEKAAVPAALQEDESEPTLPGLEIDSETPGTDTDTD